MSTIVPHYREENKDRFVDSSVLEPWVHHSAERMTKTSAIKFGESVDLISLASNDEEFKLIKEGKFTSTRMIARAPRIRTIFYKHAYVPDRIFRHDVDGIRSCTFVTRIGDRKTKASIIGKPSIKIATPGHSTIAASLHGEIDLQTGALKVFIRSVSPNIIFLGYSVTAAFVDLNNVPRPKRTGPKTHLEQTEDTLLSMIKGSDGFPVFPKALHVSINCWPFDHFDKTYDRIIALQGVDIKDRDEEGYKGNWVTDLEFEKAKELNLIWSIKWKGNQGSRTFLASSFNTVILAAKEQMEK